MEVAACPRAWQRARDTLQPKHNVEPRLIHDRRPPPAAACAALRREIDLLLSMRFASTSIAACCRQVHIDHALHQTHALISWTLQLP